MATVDDSTGYRIRRPTLDDVPATTALLRECERTDFGSTEQTEEDLRISWSLLDLEADAWLVVAGDEPVAYASGRPRGPAQVFVFAAVSPAHRGRGLGTRLLELTEERARERLAEAPAEVRFTVGQPVGQHNDGARELLLRHGYEVVRRFWEMEIELSEEPPAPEWRDGIRVEAYSPERERAIFDAVQEAFRDHWNFVPRPFEEWRAWTIERESFDGSLWSVALDGDEVAGASLCEIREDTGWVHVLGVRRPWRRAGLGLALLRRSFVQFHRRGVAKAALGVDSDNPTGATRLYEQAGMHVVRWADAYQKVLRDGAPPEGQSLPAEGEDA